MRKFVLYYFFFTVCYLVYANKMEWNGTIVFGEINNDNNDHDDYDKKATTTVIVALVSDDGSATLFELIAGPS